MTEREALLQIQSICSQALGQAPAPTPTPIPTPTPTPVPTPPGDYVSFDMGAQNASLFMDLAEGVTYSSPLPTLNDAFFEVGQGRGAGPTNVEMCISEAPGVGFDRNAPQRVEGDPAGGFSIYWSRNPAPGRGGPYQAQVSDGSRWYLSIRARVGSGSVSRKWS